MNLDLQRERVFDRVELGHGIGERDRGRMCVMAFVACLTGDEHTDTPACASPVIAAFAVALNDGMPEAVRQRLKPFAMRIAGTADGLDARRIVVLAETMREEILPQLERCEARAGSSRRALAPAWAWFRRRAVRRAARRFREQSRVDASPGQRADLARAAGVLIALGANSAGGATEAEWYWLRAIALLDRLCDVAPAGRSQPAFSAERLDWLDEVLEGRAKRAVP